MTLFHVTLRRNRPAHAIQVVVTTMVIKAGRGVRAADVWTATQDRWPRWDVVGIEEA